MWKTIGLFASLLSIVLGVHFGYILCNDHPAAFLMALVLARWTYLGFCDIQSIVDEELDTPEPKLYELTLLEVMATLKETLTYTSLGDRWWHIRDMNIDDGRLLASVSFDEQYSRFTDHHFSNERVYAQSQIVLIAEVTAPVSGRVSVRYRFVVSANYGRRTATALIKVMQETFDEALEKRVAKKKAIKEGITA